MEKRQYTREQHTEKKKLYPLARQLDRQTQSDSSLNFSRQNVGITKEGKKTMAVWKKAEDTIQKI